MEHSFYHDQEELIIIDPRIRNISTLEILFRLIS
jgi:hypothetical protein